MNTLKGTIFTLVVGMLVSISVFADANPASPTIEQFDDGLFTKLRIGISDEFNSNSFRLQSSLFDMISKQDLFKKKWGKEPEEGKPDMRVQLKGEVRRRVFDNRDLAETFTVVDIMKFPLSVPISIGSNIPVGKLNVGWNFGLNMNFSFLNIRQSSFGDLEKLVKVDSLQDTIKQVNQISKEINKENDQYDGEDPYDLLTKKAKRKLKRQNRRENRKNGLKKKRNFFAWTKNTPENNARYSKLFNLLAHPLRLPWTKRSAMRMSEGEIFSYGVDGTIQLGGSVGWGKVNWIGAESVNVGTSITTYLNGQFKISIMKEEDNKVLLKVTRIKGKGISLNTGNASAKYKYLNGFVLLKHIKIGDQFESIFPFSLSQAKSKTNQFDVAYRYDLNNANAVAAYKKAALGLLKNSEELQLNGDGVEKVFTREKIKNRSTRNYSMKLSFLLQRAHQISKEHSKLMVTNPEGVHYIFESVNMNSKGFEGVWGGHEQKDYTFKSTIKDDFFTDDDDENIAFTIEGTIRDNVTTPKEMFSYMNEVERAAGFRLFPDIPQNGPHKKCGNKKFFKKFACNIERIVLKFGKTNFYYNINFSNKQLKTFINYPTEKMWELLSRAHLKPGKTEKWNTPLKRAGYQLKNSMFTVANVPLAFVDLYIKPGNRLLSARTFYKQWQKLKGVTEPQELTKKLARLFRTVSFNYEIIKVLRSVIKSKPQSFYVTANSSKTFGAYQKSFNFSRDPDELRTYIDRVIEFDDIRQRITYDPKARVQSLNTKQLDVNTVEFKFNFKVKPNYIFLQIKPGSPWRRKRNLYQKVLINDDTFKQGDNKVVIKRTDTEGLKGELAKIIFNGKWNTLQMAIATQKDHWGEVISNRFKVRDKKEDLDKLLGDEDSGKISRKEKRELRKEHKLSERDDKKVKEHLNQ